MLLAAAATPIAMLPAAGAQGSTGDLAYQGCISGNTATGPAGSSACALIPSATAGGDNSGLDGVSGLAVSPDATSLYAGTDLDDSVARFARDPSAGALTYQSCITGRAETGPTGSAACSTNGFAISGGFNSGLNGAVTPAVSPDVDRPCTSPLAVRLGHIALRPRRRHGGPHLEGLHNRQDPGRPGGGELRRLRDDPERNYFRRRLRPLRGLRERPPSARMASRSTWRWAATTPWHASTATR